MATCGNRWPRISRPHYARKRANVGAHPGYEVNVLNAETLPNSVAIHISQKFQKKIMAQKFMRISGRLLTIPLRRRVHVVAGIRSLRRDRPRGPNWSLYRPRMTRGHAF